MNAIYISSVVCEYFLSCPALSAVRWSLSDNRLEDNDEILQKEKNHHRSR